MCPKRAQLVGHLAVVMVVKEKCALFSAVDEGVVLLLFVVDVDVAGTEYKKV